jgi:eukaryotic-like serine/threonine-protein kinase
MSSDPTAPHVEPTRPAFRDALERLCFSDEEFARKYEGWEEIGRGGFATVVKTFCRDYGHSIAVKVFSQLDDEQLARFRQEVHNARLFDSRNVVKTFGATIRGTLAWIEMEFVDGPNLRKELERRQAEGTPFSIDEAVAIGLGVSEALARGHAADVLHRDVKPANILLPRAGDTVAKLGDFGVSRFSGHAKVTKTGCSPGTPQFWAPEVCNGRPPIASSDVYSFSVCLYLLLSGNRYPYNIPEDAVVSTYQEAHRRQAPIPITVFNASAPRELQNILTLGMAKEPENRPSIREVHEALVAVATNDGKAAAHAPLRPRTTGHARTIAAGLAVAAAVAGSYFAANAALGRSGQASAPQRTQSTPNAVQGRDPTPGMEAARRATPTVLDSAVDGHALTLTNRSTDALNVREIRLGEEGRTPSIASIGTSLSPGETLMVPFDEFTPKPDARTPGDRVKVVTDGDDVTVTVAEPSEPSRF